jgi:hypothetical protein
MINAKCDYAPKEYIDPDQVPGCLFENTNECPLNLWKVEGEALISKRTGLKVWQSKKINAKKIRDSQEGGITGGEVRKTTKT